MARALSLACGLSIIYFCFNFALFYVDVSSGYQNWSVYSCCLWRSNTHVRVIYAWPCAAHEAFCRDDIGLREHANDLVLIKKADGTPKFVTKADLFGLAKQDLEVCQV